MSRSVRRPILWGTLTFQGGRRRRYLFRVDPEGILAVRIGNPFSFTVLFLVLYASFAFGWDRLGVGSLLLGGAVGMGMVGVLDSAIARGVASQPRDAVLRSQMNHFFPSSEIETAAIGETRFLTHMRFTDEDRTVKIAIRRPAPSAVHSILASRGTTR